MIKLLLAYGANINAIQKTFSKPEDKTETSLSPKEIKRWHYKGQKDGTSPQKFARELDEKYHKKRQEWFYEKQKKTLTKQIKRAFSQFASKKSSKKLQNNKNNTITEPLSNLLQEQSEMYQAKIKFAQEDPIERISELPEILEKLEYKPHTTIKLRGPNGTKELLVHMPFEK